MYMHFKFFVKNSRFLSKPLLAFASLAVISAAAQAPGDIRVALIIGNSAYPGSMALTNPANDAAAMAVALKNLGFTVVEARDASRAQMEDAVKKLFTALKGRQGVGMLYYAGHGLQVDWKNYMVPVDAKLQTSKDVPSQTLDVGDVLDAMKAAGSRMNIVVLDACRDNPFTEKGGKGLAPVDAPTGTLLAYATAPGNVAEDGTGQNGLYTKHLLAELQKPVSIESVFKRVRLNVRKESQGRQIPWESTSLEDEFYFNKDAEPQKLAATAAASKRDADFAEQKTAWDKIKDSQSADDFYEFLSKYPGGLIAEIAQVRLEKVAKAGLAMQGHKGEDAAVAINDRLRVGDEWRVRTITRTKVFGINGSDSSEMLYRVTRKVGENFEVTGESTAFLAPKTIKIMTPEGAMVSTAVGAMGSFESIPPSPTVPLVAFQAGYKSSSRIESIRNGKSQGTEDFDMNVLGREKITTALGSFDTYKIAVKTKTTGAFGSTAREFTVTSWFPQNSLIPIKSTFVMPSFNVSTEDETIMIKRATK